MTRVILAILFVSMLSLGTGCASIVSLTSGTQPIAEKPGKRTFGSVIDDEIVETKILVNIRKAAPGFEHAHLSVTSFNGVVLLAGQVPSEALREQASSIAHQVRKVRKVHNELRVSGPTSGLARSNDTWLTSKVKARMLASGNVPGRRIKVVTENGTVFLLGLVTQQEAEAAVSLVRNVRGVEKIVKVFEYIG